jgi:hypothetical protein
MQVEDWGIHWCGGYCSMEDDMWKRIMVDWPVALPARASVANGLATWHWKGYNSHSDDAEFVS